MAGPGRPRVPRSREREFWRRVRSGLTYATAARASGVSDGRARGWVIKGGGMPAISLAEPSGRYLSMAEREEIAVGLAAERSQAAIARDLGRSPSTISREIARNRAVRPNWAYRAGAAQSRADRLARRPKPSKLATNAVLCQRVQDDLRQHWSPQQISKRLKDDFPDDAEMRVTHETIYRSLYVQGRGELRRDLTACLRSGRAVRRPQRQTNRGSRIIGMVTISERPAEVEDRAVPGHWEGDLILGKNNQSAIGTLVERTTRYTLLLHLPGQHGAADVHDAMLIAIRKLPKHLWRSLTWDRGVEMAAHRQITLAADLPIYFCDPASPWQRGTNENTNGLLRQYFPKGTDLSLHTAQDLDRVAVQLNGRPRMTLNWRTPAEALNALLSEPYPTNGVATTR
jgi:transposase, IS30 family